MYYFTSIKMTPTQEQIEEARRLFSHFIDWRKMIVIGNKFENPELLNPTSDAK